MANSRSSYCLHRRNAGYQVVHGCPCAGSVSFDVWGASPGDESPGRAQARLMLGGASLQARGAERSLGRVVPVSVHCCLPHWGVVGQ